MHDYEGVTLACDDDKQIERTLCAMWGLLSTVTRGLLLHVMTTGGFREFKSW